MAERRELWISPEEQERITLGEAFRIAQGSSRVVVRREHIVAVIEHCRKLASAILELPEIKEIN